MNRRAFTLIEVIFTMGLLLLILGGFILATRKPVQSAGSRAVAEQVAEFFRMARNRAIAQQVPLAVMIPNDNGGADFSQSVALLEGQSNPAVSRVLNFAGDHPATVLTVATYPTGATWSKAPVWVGNSQVMVGGTPSPASVWFGSRQDFMFLFMPDGSVVTNDLPHDNGVYHVVVSQGLVTTTAGVGGSGIPVASPPPYLGLAAACDPYTVTINGLGAVHAEPGLPGLTGGVSLQSSPLPLGLPATPPPVLAASVMDPTIDGIFLYPPAGAVASSVGASGTLGPNRQLTLSALANVANDDDLFCQVTVTGVRADGTPAGPGLLSSGGEKAMRYQWEIPPLVPDAWVSNWQWRPPLFAQSGDRYTFTVDVNTRRGGSATSSGNASLTKTIQIFDEGQIFFGGEDPYNNRFQIFVIRADGTDLRRVTYETQLDHQAWPNATRDGNKLLYTEFIPFVSAELWGRNRAGGLDTPIATGAGFSMKAVFSDDSTVAVYERGIPPAAMTLYTFNPDGLWPPAAVQVFDPDPPGATIGLADASVSPARPFPGAAPPDAPVDTRLSMQPRRLAFVSDLHAPGTRSIYTSFFYNPTTSLDWTNARILRQTAGGPAGAFPTIGGDHWPRWHPDGTKLLFVSDRLGGQKIFAMNYSDSDLPLVDEPSVVCLTPGFNNATEACYSPDGRKIAFVSDDSGVWDLYVLPLDPAGQTFGQPGYCLNPLGAPYALDVNAYIFFGSFPELNSPSWTL